MSEMVIIYVLIVLLVVQTWRVKSLESKLSDTTQGRDRWRNKAHDAQKRIHDLYEKIGRDDEQIDIIRRNVRTFSGLTWHNTQPDKAKVTDE